MLGIPSVWLPQPGRWGGGAILEYGPVLSSPPFLSYRRMQGLDLPDVAKNISYQGDGLGGGMMGSSGYLSVPATIAPSYFLHQATAGGDVALPLPPSAKVRN